MTSRSLWNYYRYKKNDVANENNSDNYAINDKKRTTCKSFEYKTNVVGVKRFFVLVYLNGYNNIKRFKARRHYLP